MTKKYSCDGDAWTRSVAFETCLSVNSTTYVRPLAIIDMIWATSVIELNEYFSRMKLNKWCLGRSKVRVHLKLFRVKTNSLGNFNNTEHIWLSAATFCVVRCGLHAKSLLEIFYLKQISTFFCRMTCYKFYLETIDSNQNGRVYIRLENFNNRVFHKTMWKLNKIIWQSNTWIWYLKCNVEENIAANNTTKDVFKF